MDDSITENLFPENMIENKEYFDLNILFELEPVQNGYKDTVLNLYNFGQ